MDIKAAAAKEAMNAKYRATAWELYAYCMRSFLAADVYSHPLKKPRYNPANAKPCLPHTDRTNIYSTKRVICSPSRPCSLGTCTKMTEAYECDPRRCGAGEACENRRFQNRIWTKEKKMEVIRVRSMSCALLLCIVFAVKHNNLWSILVPVCVYISDTMYHGQQSILHSVFTMMNGKRTSATYTGAVPPLSESSLHERKKKLRSRRPWKAPWPAEGAMA